MADVTHGGKKFWFHDGPPNNKQWVHRQRTKQDVMSGAGFWENKPYEPPPITASQVPSDAGIMAAPPPPPPPPSGGGGGAPAPAPAPAPAAPPAAAGSGAKVNMPSIKGNEPPSMTALRGRQSSGVEAVGLGQPVILNNPGQRNRPSLDMLLQGLRY